MPHFCRHNRLVQNCPICSRERSVEARPLVSSATPGTSAGRPASKGARRDTVSSAGAKGRARNSHAGLRVRRLARGSDDGFRSPLVPGLRSTEDAERLASELAFAAARLHLLEHDPPGLYAEVADRKLEPEERIWLALLVAYLGPLEAPDPFAEIQRVRTSWASDELPDLINVALGPRAAHDPAHGTRTLEAYRRWAARAGSQQTGLLGEPAWSGERRFERAFERLALPGFQRNGRFEFLTSLGMLGVLELRPGNLRLAGDDAVTVAAKRALGIGDPLLLGRRATALATECAIPLAALDLGLYNWEAEERACGGVVPPLRQEPDILEPVRSALGL